MAADVVARVAAALRRPFVAGAVLLVIYAALSLAMDPHGYLGTDTGAKVATLEVMVRDGTADPDVGYWAAAYDPDGSLHPLYQSKRRDDDGWVAVSTLPVLELARPLYDVGGYRLALLLPMLGAIGAAFASRAVARRIGATDGGWTAFWIVGLASPMAVYALDFWEHTIGVACMVAAVALLLDVANGKPARLAVGAGALLGTSAVLRNETFVYALVAVGLACVVAWRRSGAVSRALAPGLFAVAGFAVPWLANVVLEGVVGASAAATRAARTTGTAEAVGSGADQRGREALLTLFGTNRGELEEAVLLGAAIVVLVLLALWWERRAEARIAVGCLIGAAALYLAAALDGLGFVPGLLLAFPMAIAGLLQGAMRPQARLVAVVAVAALPLVYLFQYTGGAGPQWGGRYTLTSSILLGVVGVVALGVRYPVTARALVVLSVAVTGFGVAWLGQRSHGVDAFFDDVVEQSAPVLISTNPFLVREGGSVSVGRRWLSAAGDDQLGEAIDVVRSVGETRFSVLEWGRAAPSAAALPAGVREVSRSQLTFVNVPVGLVTYELRP